MHHPSRRSKLSWIHVQLGIVVDSIRAIGRGRAAQSGKFATNFLWLTAENMFRLGLGLVVGLAVARELGPTQYGVLSYATAAAALCTIIAALGLDGIVQRDLVKAGPDGWNDVLGTAFLLRMSSALILYGAYAIIIVATTPDPETQTACLVIGLGLVLNPAVLLRTWFQAQVAAKHAVMTQLVGFSIGAGARIYLLWRREATVNALAWISVGELALSALLLAIAYGKVRPGRAWRWRWSPGYARQWAGEAWTQLLSGLAIFVYMRIDQLMLEKMAGTRSVGIYSAAVKVSELGYFVPVMLGATLLPSVVRTRESDLGKYVRRRQLYFDFSALIAVGFALPIAIFAPQVISLLFGQEYADASHILRIHAWSALFVFTGVARGQYLLTEGLLRFSFFATLAGAIINVALNFVLIPRLGGVGAAWATLVAYAISALASSFVYAPARAIGRQQWDSFHLINAVLRLAARQ